MEIWLEGLEKVVKGSAMIAGGIWTRVFPNTKYQRMPFSFFIYRHNGAICNYVVKNCMVYAPNDTRIFLNWKFLREAELKYHGVIYSWDFHASYISFEGAFLILSTRRVQSFSFRSIRLNAITVPVTLIEFAVSIVDFRLARSGSVRPN